jgi:hypothetical protein
MPRSACWSASASVQITAAASVCYGALVRETGARRVGVSCWYKKGTVRILRAVPLPSYLTLPVMGEGASLTCLDRSAFSACGVTQLMFWVGSLMSQVLQVRSSAR